MTTQKSLFLKKYKEIIFLVILSILFGLFMIWDLKSWYYSAIGDEYAFFIYAKNIALNRMPIHLTTLFSQDGVYSTIPVLSGIYQGIVMKIFGINVVGWKTSQILIIIFSIFPLFYLVKDLWNRKTAFVTVLLFLFSHYIWAYIKTGYCNLESIFPTIMALYFVNKGLKKKNNEYLFLAGLMAGLGFYTFYSSRAIIPILIFILLATIKKYGWKIFIPTILGFLLLFLPFLIVNKQAIYQTMFMESLVSSNEARSIPRYQLLLENVPRNFFAFVNNTHVGPYVAGSLVDLITGAFFIIGFIWTLIKIKEYRYFFLLFWFDFAFLATGVFSKFSYVTVSRLNYLIPIIVLFSAISLNQIIDKLIKNRKINILTTTIILIMIFILNYYQFYYFSPNKFQLTSEAVAIKALQTVCQNKKTLVLDPHPEPLLVPATESYQIPNVYYQTIDQLTTEPENGYQCYIVLRPHFEIMANVVEQLKKSYSQHIIKDTSKLTTVFTYTQ